MLALYQTVVFGGMAVGAWAWGELADRTSLEAAYLLGGMLLLGSLACTGGCRSPRARRPT